LKVMFVGNWKITCEGAISWSQLDSVDKPESMPPIKVTLRIFWVPPDT